jgi:hypothetical protein
MLAVGTDVYPPFATTFVTLAVIVSYHHWKDRYMNRFTATLAVSAVAVTLGACADTSSEVAGPSDLKIQTNVSELADGPGSIGRHIMLTRAGYAANAASKTAGTGGGTGIFYHGGPVLQTGTNVVAIYWAGTAIYNGGPTPGTTGAGSQDGSLIGHFLRNLGGSPYFGINATYTDGSGAKIANIVNYNGFWANNANAPSGTTSISDAQMVAMLQSGFDGGKITYDPSTVYTIFSSGKVNLGGGFATGSLKYCAYHTHGTVTINGAAKTVLYAAMPYDYSFPGSCTNNTASPNNDPGADAEVNTLAHEIEETTTDMMGTAWYDRRGYENADKCAWTWGATYTNANGGVANMNLGGKDFLVQRNWRNSGSGGCFLS